MLLLDLSKSVQNNNKIIIITITIITIVIIIIVIITIIIIRWKLCIPEARKYWVDVQRGDSLISWGEGFSLALVGNPSRDGVLIKTLVWSHLKPNSQFLSVNYV